MEEWFIYWRKTNIPTQEPHKCKDKLKALFDIGQKLVKDSNKIILEKQQELSSNLEDLFDKKKKIDNF